MEKVKINQIVLRTWIVVVFGIILVVLLIIDIRNYQLSQPVHTKHLSNVAVPKTDKPYIVAGKSK